MEEVVNELSILKENNITITKRLDGIEGAIHQRFAYLEATFTNYQSIITEITRQVYNGPRVVKIISAKGKKNLVKNDF